MSIQCSAYHQGPTGARDGAEQTPWLSLSVTLQISTATGRTMEFKGRDGSDKGRSVTAKGYWGDIVNSPYLCFGVTCDDRR